MEIVSAGHAARASDGFSDNTVEVQLPFVSRFFPEVPIIAVHSPSSEKAFLLGKTISRLLADKGLKAAFIGSADLTHYGPNYGFSPKGIGDDAVAWVKNENDKSVIDHALAMASQEVLKDAAAKRNTCSAGPIASVIGSAADHGITEGRLLEYYTSYDVMPNTSFVGYAAIIY
jgi:AmmeMemoRadiSam system protein B